MAFYWCCASSHVANTLCRVEDVPTALSGQALRDSRSENHGVLLDPLEWPLDGQMLVNEATLIRQLWLEVFSGRGKLRLM